MSPVWAWAHNNQEAAVVLLLVAVVVAGSALAALNLHRMSRRDRKRFAVEAEAQRAAIRTMTGSTQVLVPRQVGRFPAGRATVVHRPRHAFDEEAA